MLTATETTESCCIRERMDVEIKHHPSEFGCIVPETDYDAFLGDEPVVATFHQSDSPQTRRSWATIARRSATPLYVPARTPLSLKGSAT